ncbi:hypothetical protein ACFFSY_02040 [Paenibacillus aurantiacus]|uniref:Uncharacterized protein n=1 Tax=Paenibacillus aurantiacus TaxID=1936118 RepID=A0ABV5KHL3_9BACL
MEQEKEKEIKELKERLTIVENKLLKPSRPSTGIKFLLGFVIVFVILLITIGILQFIGASST